VLRWYKSEPVKSLNNCPRYFIRCVLILSFHIILTNFMELSPSWEAASCAATQELPSIFGTRKFNTGSTSALHSSLFRARPIQFIPPHYINLNPLSYFPPTYFLVYLVVSFLLAFPPISYMSSSSPHSCYMFCPSHPHRLGHSKFTWRRICYEASHYAAFSNLPSLHSSSD
jgi:hypothetical protein